ncbi:MAG: T9SS type A sorting domain-containing protein, partial [Ignavibacteriaceae bacterium]
MTTTDIQEPPEHLPKDFQLYQNYPNPFNPSTTLSFVIGQSSFVSLKVYDMLGNEVATLVDEYKPAGKYEVEFNADSHSGKVRSAKGGLPSGVYFYQLQSGDFISTKSMVMIK